MPADLRFFFEKELKFSMLCPLKLFSFRVVFSGWQLESPSRQARDEQHYDLISGRANG